MRSLSLTLSSLVLLAAALASCGGDDSTRPAVFAASSLTEAFTEIGDAYADAGEGTATFNFAASSALRIQLEQGAPGDVFASADEAQMALAVASGAVILEPAVFAKNELVVAYPASNPGEIGSLEDLARPGLKLVLAAPDVPIGVYARQALASLAEDPSYGSDFADEVLGNVRSEESNVRAALAKVQLGEADATIVYATDITAAVANDVATLTIPGKHNVEARYLIAVTAEADDREQAAAFVAFVRGPEGQEILRRHGFVVDEETGRQ